MCGQRCTDANDVFFLQCPPPQNTTTRLPTRRVIQIRIIWVFKTHVHNNNNNKSLLIYSTGFYVPTEDLMVYK